MTVLVSLITAHCNLQREKGNEVRNTLPLLLKTLARGDRQGQAITEEKLSSFFLH